MLSKSSNMMMVTVVSVVVLVLLLIAFLVHRRKQQKEKYCGACQGVGNKVYPDKELIRKLYKDGKLTENTPLYKGPEWAHMSWDDFLAHSAK